MKRLVLIGIAGFGFAIGVAAQGLIALDNSANANGVAINTPGNYYTGTYGMEVWELNTSSIPAGFNNLASVDPGWAYVEIVTGRWRLELTLANQTMRDGTFSLGSWILPDVTPIGSKVVLALAVWNSGAPNGIASLYWLDSFNALGVIAFVNPTAAPTINGSPPVPASLSGWTTSIGDLVMIVGDIPETSTFSLVGLGAGILLSMRRMS